MDYFKTDVKSVIKDSVLNKAYAQAGFRERDCMDKAKEIRIIRTGENKEYLLLHFVHADGFHTADYSVLRNRWIG